jgi:perosamine synthetase
MIDGKRNIPIAKPIIGNDEISAVSHVLESGLLASGKNVEHFEKEFADYCGTEYAIATNNGTTALHASLLAAGVGPGDEVIVPSFSFIATATAVSMTGAKPVFSDVDGTTFNINPLKIHDKITSKTKAIIGVHLFGLPCDVMYLNEICESHNLTFIEDAAQAHGAKLKSRKVGDWGDMGCFSFYATKNMTTGEGGMITTSDKNLYNRLKLLVNHGQSEKYLHTCLGYNYRMTDIAAAIGRVQLEKLDTFNTSRNYIAKYYNQHLNVNGLILPHVFYIDLYHVYHQYVMYLTPAFPIERSQFLDYLKSNGIGHAIHYPIPIHRQPLYVKNSNGFDTCPISTSLSESVVSIPVHPALNQSDVEYICKIINEVE